MAFAMAFFCYFYLFFKGEMLMNLIKFTVSLNNLKMEKRRHAVRHAISWINGLDYNELKLRRC